MKWICTDGNADVEITAETAEEAAQGYVDGGEWESEPSTWWIDIHCTPIDDDGEEIEDEAETITVEVEPEEPECQEADHDWCSPLEVVGGIESNPGVWGHGGGLKITEVCRHCGAYRITNTWAQRQDTGEQGLRSTEYRDADGDSLAWVESQRRYRAWFKDGSAVTFSGADAEEMADRDEFNAADLGPGCDIELLDDNDEVVGGVVEDK